MILVLTGPVGSGKTTFLKELLAKLQALGVPASGYLSPAVLVDGEPSGYDLLLVQSGRSVPFLRRGGEAGWQAAGPYRFLPEGLETASSSILSSGPGTLLIVDEVGPAEFSGDGVWPALAEALKRPAVDCLLVVREALIEKLRHRLGDRRFYVFDVKNEYAQEAILKSLTEPRTIRLTVKFFGPFRDVFGGREIELALSADASLGELLTRISDTLERKREIFAGTGILQPHVVIMQNGVPVQGPGGLDRPLQTGDVIAIFPFLGGG